MKKKIIELDFRQITPDKNAQNLLCEYALNPNSEIILIILIEKLTSAQMLAAWFKQLDKVATVIALPVLKGQLFTKWIKKRARQYQLILTEDAVEFLAEVTQGQSTATAHYLEQLYLLKATTTIDRSMLINFLEDQSLFSIFDFTTALLHGDQKKALAILQRLQSNQTEPALILWGLCNEIRLAIHFLHAVNQADTLSSLFTKHRVFYDRQKAMQRFIQYNTLSHCSDYLLEAGNIDRQIKGLSEGNVWHRLQIFCLRIR